MIKVGQDQYSTLIATDTDAKVGLPGSARVSCCSAPGFEHLPL